MHKLDAADLAELRGDVDDGAGLALQHGREHRADTKEVAAHMHGEHAVEVFGFQIDEARLVDVARIVDEMCAVAMRVATGSGDGVDIGLFRDVAANGDGFALRLLDLGDYGHGGIEAYIVGGDGIAVAGQPQCDGAADA